jgi:superfamily II DNA/RNA helicase
LANQYLQDHQTVDLIGDELVKMPDRITHIAIQCSPATRMSTLADVVKVYSKGGRTLVFAPTKAQANEIAQRSSLSNRKFTFILIMLIL